MTTRRTASSTSRSPLPASCWLLAHHGQTEAVWLVTWQKAVPGRYVPHEHVLDELVAFGWTDGIRRRVDDERSRQLVSPRRSASGEPLPARVTHTRTPALGSPRGS